MKKLDESVFWVDFSTDAGLPKRPLIEPLWDEGRELLAVVVASLKTAKGKTKQDSKTKSPGGAV